MNLKELRMINAAQIKTLLKTAPASPELFRAQVVAQILADEQNLTQMSTAELSEVLLALGLKAEVAPTVIAQLKRQCGDKKL